MRKYISPNWDRYRGEALKIGMIISLAFVLFAFNYTRYDSPAKEIIFTDLVELEDEIPVRTTDFPKPPAPPIIKDVPEIILNAPEPPRVEVVQVQKVDNPIEDKAIIKTEVVNVPVKFKPSPAPKPKPAPIVPPKKSEDNKPEEALRFADYMPLFGECSYDEADKSTVRNCSDKAILKYFARKIKYPTPAKQNGIEGKVAVEFHIDKFGNIKDAIIRRDIGGGCGDEVLRVIKGMPKWKAGKHNGRPVAVKFTMPVSFVLN